MRRILKSIIIRKIYIQKQKQAHDFCGFVFMFLTPPTLEELNQSDLPDLMDMLSNQSIEYSRIIKLEGVTSKSNAIKELILNIQTAIESKKVSEKSKIIG
ncbi:MAG TPA: hypothetical protein VK492_14175 [Chitinophagaceae bacterium]|nr:hypothetical protein [Chitinophagaceae bacterium]